MDHHALTVAPSRRGLLTIVLCAAFALRAAAVLLLGGRDPGPDAVNDYLPMAANVLAGRGFINGAGHPDSVRGPGFPLFAAVVQWVLPGDDVGAVLWAQVVLDTATVWLAWRIAANVLGAAAGLWSAVLYAVNPLSMYACALVGPEILFAFLLTAALAALQVGGETHRRRWLAISGFAVGAAVLTRATPVLLVPVWGVWLVWKSVRWGNDSQRRPEHGDAADGRRWSPALRRGIADALILGATSAAVVLPWTWRNWRVFGEFIPVVANGGVNFYAGSSERFWPPPPEHHRQRDLRLHELIEAGAIPEPPDRWRGPASADKYFFAAGAANYRLAWEQDSFTVLGYLARKSLRLWYATQSGRMQTVTGVVNAAWLALAVWGAFAAARRGRLRALAPCLLTILYFPAVLVGMFPLARYVVGFAPCLCIAGGAAAEVAAARLMGRSRDSGRECRSRDRQGARGWA